MDVDFYVEPRNSRLDLVLALPIVCVLFSDRVLLPTESSIGAVCGNSNGDDNGAV